MKELLKLIFFLALLGVYGCSSGNTTDASGKDDKNKINDMDSFLIRNNSELDSIYRDLPTVSLPLSYDMVIADELDFYEIPDNFFYLFYNNEYFENGSDIAKLPPKGEYLPFIISYLDAEGDRAIDLYTFKTNLEVIDRLEVASIEKLMDGEVVISKLFEISKEYTIKVYKLLNEQLIEQLYYRITDEGTFEEIRDGKTLAIAYESPDNIHYTVENFIWDHNSAGGLVKRDLSVNYYKVTDDGEVVRTDREGRKE